jgi:hypothetical protein
MRSRAAWRKLLIGGACLSLAPLAYACGGDDSHPGSPQDAGTADGSLDATRQDSSAPQPDAAPDAGDDAPCNTLQNTASTISYTGMPGAPLAPQGGSVAAGTYYLTAANVYALDGGTIPGTIQETVVYAANGTAGFDRKSVTNQGLGDERANQTAVPYGNQITVTYVCPPQSPYTVPYTFDTATNALHLYSASSIEYVYTKQ